MSTPQHRKPGQVTKARTLTVKAAAIAAVAVPGAALAAHELAGQQPETAPLHPVDDSRQLTLPTTGHPNEPQGDPAPSAVQSMLLHRISELRATPAAEPGQTAAATKSVAASAKTPATAPKKTTTVSYTVQEGDSLSAIAERTLGSANSYTEIFALNKDRAEPGGARFTNASLIQPGWTLTLPSGAKTQSGTATSANWTTSSKSTDSSASSSTSRRTSSSSSTDTHKTESAGNTDTRATGDLNNWINDAVSVLAEHGMIVSYNAVYETVIHESGGNPNAVNGEDSNAAEGHPSIGLMQTIQSTFDAYALPGHDDIYNPVDNIIAGARYAAAVYGSLDEMVEARCDGSCWRGY